ncbi:MAG: glycoside hydrolase family 88/105 protein [bacterium]
MIIDLKETALRCVHKAEQTIDFGHYSGLLLLHGLARWGVLCDDKALVERARQHLEPFVRGEKDFYANFKNYYCGGNAAAYLLAEGQLPEVEEDVRRYAEELMTEAPRDSEGIFSHPRFPGEERIWIDVAFAVTPFLLYAGRHFDEEKYIEEAWQQTAKMVRVFRNEETGLLHQSRNFRGKGHMSEDHWGRGNGWGIFALTELVNGLAKDDPRRPEAEGMFTDLCRSCLRVQDCDGMFHQELTDHDSYVETSGTGLILYAFGVGIGKGLLDERFREALEKGIRASLSYIGVDGSVHNTCPGCLCPGDGTKEDYKRKAPVLNDTHAFGSPIFSMGQAVALGIENIEI